MGKRSQRYDGFLEILACGLRHVIKVGEIGSAVYLVVDGSLVELVPRDANVHPAGGERLMEVW